MVFLKKNIIKVWPQMNILSPGYLRSVLWSQENLTHGELNFNKSESKKSASDSF